jgi:hypothetical protein
MLFTYSKPFTGHIMIQSPFSFTILCKSSAENDIGKKSKFRFLNIEYCDLLTIFSLSNLIMKFCDCGKLFRLISKLIENVGNEVIRSNLIL